MTAEYQSWDAFWAEVEQEHETEVICGVRVRVPTDVPLSFDRRLEAFSDSSSEDDIRDLVTELYGTGVYDQWIEAGMTGLGFRTALGWGVARAKGRRLTFREAYELMRAAEDGPGNAAAALLAQNREQRRAASKQPSERTGGRSKRISNGSTSSGQQRSRR